MNIEKIKKTIVIGEDGEELGTLGQLYETVSEINGTVFCINKGEDAKLYYFKLALIGGTK